MCIKYVFYNTYSDNQFDITERVEACTPGYICANPKTLHFDREYAVPRDEAKPAQARSDRQPGPPSNPSSRSTSPAARAAASEASSAAGPPPARGRPRHSGVYVDGTRISATAATPSAASPSASPRTMPIPIKRAATMTYGGMEPPPERGRRPIIVEERVPFASAFSAPRVMPVSPPTHADIYHHSTRRLRELREPREPRDVRLDRGASLRRPAPATSPDSHLLSPSRARRDRSPQGYGSAEDEQERAERRRRRRAARERAAVLPSSLPAMGNTDVFGSSYESSASGVGTGTGVSSPAASPRTASASPAAAAVRKELRWEDEQRRLHNERIERRPKLQGEVRSILKNAGSAAASPVASPGAPESRSRASSRASSTRPPSSSSRRASFAGGADDRLAAGLSGLAISTPPSPAASAADGPPAFDAERSRLRNRFSMPPRRYTAGGSFRRRSEIWYPDDGRYRYM